jgi:hypothetical protein
MIDGFTVGLRGAVSYNVAALLVLFGTKLTRSFRLLKKDELAINLKPPRCLVSFPRRYWVAPTR